MEILAPAGNLDILKAAIQAGCDAVYISGKDFGARKFAGNFTNEQIEEAVKYAHLRGKKVYITVNTIIYDHEFSNLDKFLSFLDSIKVDAVIVQDLGVLHFIRKNYPKLIVHASTQMNIHNVEGAIKLKELGVKRVVLARETSINDVKKIIDTGIEVEVFGHGALCYSYSGQCLMSFNVGGRSGNRGECAQPCRKKYTLLENNEKISNECSLLSMKDLNTLDYILELKKIGVTSLKIEGRMKSINYVTTVVKIYKNHLNNIKEENDLNNLKVSFNRDFVKGYLFNNPNHDMTNILGVNHQGILIGKVVSVNKYGIELYLDDSLELNDGIRIKSKEEVGFYVNNLRKNGNLYFISGNFNVKVNDLVFKTVSNKLNVIANEYLKCENYHIDLDVMITIKQNQNLVMKVRGLGVEAIASGEILTETAMKPISIERICEQVRKTDSLLLNVDNINIDYDNIAFVKISEINALRRDALSKWMNLYLDNYKLEENDPYIFENNVVCKNKNIEFDFLVHTKEQYEWCLSNNFNNIYSFYGDSNLKYISHFHSNSVECSNNIVHNLSDYKENSILSISTNVINSESLEILNKYNIKALYLSTELSDEEIYKLSQNNTNYDLGVMVYGKSKMLVSKHCFIAKLKNINNIKCGNCLKNHYHIVDEYNNKMPVFSRCNNEPELIIYNYKTKNNIKNISNYVNNKINRFLFVFTDESVEELNKLKESINLMREKYGKY